MVVLVTMRVSDCLSVVDGGDVVGVDAAHNVLELLDGHTLPPSVIGLAAGPSHVSE